MGNLAIKSFPLSTRKQKRFTKSIVTQEQDGPDGHHTKNTGSSSRAGMLRPSWLLTIILVSACALWETDARRPPRQVPGPRAPNTLVRTQGTYVTKYSYEKLRVTHVDTNIIRPQPAPAKAAHGLSIITMNVTSWNSKVYQYVASLHHDVIFIQEHRKTMASHIKVPKGYKMIFSQAHVTGHKLGGTQNTSGGVAILIKDKLHIHKSSQHIQYGGHNWAAVTITLHDGYHLNLVTSYTKHGHELEALNTFTKVREFLDTFTIPYVWGGTSIAHQGNLPRRLARMDWESDALPP